MTTIDSFAKGFNPMTSGFIHDKIEVYSFRKENAKTILTIAKVLAMPIIIIKNITVLIKILRFKNKLYKFVKNFETLFLNGTSEQKMDLYADFNMITESINDSYNYNVVSETNKRPITRAIITTYKGIHELLNTKDQHFFKLAYPDSIDFASPEYIREAKEYFKDWSVEY